MSINKTSERRECRILKKIEKNSGIIKRMWRYIKKH